MISPLAYVDSAAKIGKNVTIQPFAFIEGNVEIGDDCIIMSGAKILHGTRMGKGNKVHHNAVLGAEPQDFHYTGENSMLIIGDNNDIRENVVVSRATHAGSATRIGNENYLMDGVHLCHDVQIGNHCVLGIKTTVAGECQIDDCTILSSNVILHQYCHIGSWVLIQAGCRISKDVPPYIIMNGNPAEYHGINAAVLQHKHQVTEILADVKSGGDRSLREVTRRVEGRDPRTFEIPADVRAAAAALIPAALKEALAAAKANIETFHRAQLPPEVDIETMPGVRCVQRAVPIRRVGLYIPGGKAPLFSTVLMLAVPARVAGCGEVILCTPARPDGTIAPEILYAADLCGVDRIFSVGGAQAVAAMAYGTESIPRVDKIFGPGNRYVTKAKQLVGANDVAVDLPAGPSEVLVLADDEASPAFAAADLLSQAEHGGDSQAVLVCPSVEFARDTQRAVGEQLLQLRRGETIREALRQSRIVVLDSREKMIGFANAYAPEHLIISMRDAWDVAAQITAAGSVFIGPWSPESAGDYASGTNHTLPTGGWARAYSGVNTDSFLRKITYQELSRKGLAALSPTVIAMAEAEGLGAHAAAVRVRMKGGVL